MDFYNNSIISAARIAVLTNLYHFKNKLYIVLRLLFVYRFNLENG
jgi:hypothetical protein